MITATTVQAVHERGACALALAGGNTPRAVYETLAGASYRQKIPWRQVHFFWGDERMVPPEHMLSNFRMTNEAWLLHVPIPAENIHRMKGELAPEEAARDYRNELEHHFRKRSALPDSPSSIFDLVLLGLGEDGHTASLFPKTHAVAESRQAATAVFVPQMNQWRVTLTLPVFNRARKVAFLASGKSKAQIISSILKLERGETQWPASLVQPASGELHWLLDAEAASLLHL
jgi:6-phosphogluconolactonase